MSLEGLPSVSDAALPREVRDGSADDKKAYRAALGFERMLVAQLTEQLSDSATGSEEESSTPAPYREMLSDALADGVIAGGGLGLAEQLYRGMRPEGSK